MIKLYHSIFWGISYEIMRKTFFSRGIPHEMTTFAFRLRVKGLATNVLSINFHITVLFKNNECYYYNISFLG